nr:immunoglobulin heavy chain junction region [Mus musculus]
CAGTVVEVFDVW